MKATNSIDKLENVINNIINYGLNNTLIAKEFSDEFKSLEKNGLVNVDKIIKRILETRIGDFKEKLAAEFIMDKDTPNEDTSDASDASDKEDASNESDENKCINCKDKDSCPDYNDDSELPLEVRNLLEEIFLGKRQSTDSDSTEDTKVFMLPMEELENFQKLIKAIKTLKLNLDIKDLYKVENGVFYFNTPKGKNSFDTKRIN